MELIYSMRRKSLKIEPPNFDNVDWEPEVVRPICTISSCNIIAFSSLTELSDVEGDSWGGHVYVCDLDTPWETHKVISTTHPVSALEWDTEGKQLLVATTEGDVSVLGQKDHLLNNWVTLYNASFPGEHIIKASFFHNGRRAVGADKKPDAPVTERIQMLRHAPTLKGFGGVAVDGALIVTGTGLIGALACPEGAGGAGGAGGGARALTATDGRPVREHVIAADIAHKAGTALVAVAWRRGRSRGVRCAAVNVVSAARAPALAVAVAPLPAICLPDGGNVCVWWVNGGGGGGEADWLLVGGGGARLALWRLQERQAPVHKLLAKGPVQGSTTPGGGPKPGSDCFNTVVWQQTAAWPVEGGERVRCVTGARGAGAGAGGARAVLATDRALHLVAPLRDAHHYICSRTVVTGGAGGAAADTAPSAAANKKAKYGPGLLMGGSRCARVSHAELSALGAVCVCLDTHSQLHVYRLPLPADTLPTPLSVASLAQQLEYGMVAGLDCLDLLLALKPAALEPLYERFTEVFQRQPQAFQQYYFHHWLKIRIALCSMSPATVRSAASLSALQMALATWAACGAALRPDDKPDALDDLTHPEIDKSLLALESKADVSTESGSLQALQALQPLRRPLERAVDTALTALAALPLPNQHHQSHGYEVCTDVRALGVLRQLVGAARAGGRGGEGARALAVLLARLAAAAAAGGPVKGDLLEECAALCAQYPTRVWEQLPRTCVAAPHGRPWPLYLEYGVEPEYLRYCPEPPPPAQSDCTPLAAMDAIRYMYLGGGRRPRSYRACGRCGVRTLPAPAPARHPLQRAYDARFLPACRCGGKWTFFSNI